MLHLVAIREEVLDNLEGFVVDDLKKSLMHKLCFRKEISQHTTNISRFPYIKQVKYFILVSLQLLYLIQPSALFYHHCHLLNIR